MFARIRLRMTLWYTGVLAALLIIAGLLLYVGMQTALLGPVNDLLATSFAQRPVYEWSQRGEPPQQCSPDAPPGSAPILFACYDASGNLIGANRLASLSPGFLTSPLAQSAAGASGDGRTDTVDGGSYFGAVRRYAVAVKDGNNQVIGVLQVGVSIESYDQALHTLIVLLLLVGALTLLGSALGGIYLAHRALEPARLALERQRAFTADASHELRTPLTLLRTNAEVLLSDRERFEPEDAALLEDIVAEADHLSTLASTLLDQARLDSGALQLERDVVDLSEVASDVAHRVRAFAAEKGVTVAVEQPRHALVIGDRSWLGHVALIVVDNAVKYNRPGGSVTIRPVVEGTQAVLVVRDTGVGIGAEHLPHLGERFYRVDKARSRGMGGAGLGLSIARSIVAAHSGTLSFESTPGQGTAVTLRLPAAATAKPESVTRPVE